MFTSCVPYKYIDIQFLNNPEIEYSVDYYKPLILANTYKNYSDDKSARFEFALDSVAVMESAITLSEELVRSPWYEGQEIPVRYNQRTDSSRYIKPLTWQELERIAQNDSADLIISLEYIKVKPLSENFSKWNGESEYFYGFLQVSLYSYWRIYRLDKKTIESGYLNTDTLVWDATDWSPIVVGNQVPGYFSSAAQVGYRNAIVYSKKIAPIWQDDIRILFIQGSKDMHNASVFAQRGEWINAAAEWQRIIMNARAYVNSLIIAVNLSSAKNAMNRIINNPLGVSADEVTKLIARVIDFENKPLTVLAK